MVGPAKAGSAIYSARMSDDWRLRVDLHEDGRAHSLAERLEASELEHDLETEFHDRVVVSHDGAEIFCYTGSSAQAEAVEQLIRSLAAEHGWHLDSELKRWHASAEEWEDPDKELPESDAQRVQERAELIAREREEAKERGYPEFEVRVQCASHRDAMRFVETLRAQGLPSIHRWKYVLIPAEDEDSAAALAERLRNDAPAGSTVAVEGTSWAAYAERPPNPFAIFGGLGV
jgi:hypothetical protein